MGGSRHTMSREIDAGCRCVLFRHGGGHLRQHSFLPRARYGAGLILEALGPSRRSDCDKEVPGGMEPGQAIHELHFISIRDFTYLDNRLRQNPSVWLNYCNLNYLSYPKYFGNAEYIPVSKSAKGNSYRRRRPPRHMFDRSAVLNGRNVSQKLFLPSLFRIHNAAIPSPI